MGKLPKTPLNSMRKLAGLAPTLVGGGILLLASVPPTLATPAPSCVRTYLNDAGVRDYLTVVNGCSSSVRVKVVLAFHTDLACTTIPRGGRAYFSWLYPGRFDRLDRC